MYLKKNLTPKEREDFLQRLWYQQYLISHHVLSIGQLIERRYEYESSNYRRDERKN